MVRNRYVTVWGMASGPAPVGAIGYVRIAVRAIAKQVMAITACVERATYQSTRVV